MLRFKETPDIAGLTIYQADDNERPGNHYVIQRKEGATQWRVAFREADDEPLRIIYVTTSLTDAKKYAKTFQSRL